MPKQTLTRSERDALMEAEYVDRQMGWKLLSSRTCRIRTIRTLVAKGLLKSAGPTYLCDGDGWLVEPEQIREGWELTPAGRDALASLRAIGGAA